MSGPDSIAFVAAGVGVTVAQRDAGIAAMVGRFTAWDVRRALTLAGCKEVDRAADRIMQAERKARRIQPVTNRIWERIA